jgi:predicted RNA-binding protein with TRAM domain
MIKMFPEKRTPKVILTVGQVIELTIEGAGTKGDPYGRIGSLIVFVPELKNKKLAPGEVLHVSIVRVMENCVIARKLKE